MNGERGQALPIAMLALAIGSLVVIPFVSHAGTSLVSSNNHREVISEQSSSDAGVSWLNWTSASPARIDPVKALRRE